MFIFEPFPIALLPHFAKLPRLPLLYRYFLRAAFLPNAFLPNDVRLKPLRT